MTRRSLLVLLWTLLGCSNVSPSQMPAGPSQAPDAGNIYGQRTAFRDLGVAFFEVDVVSRQERTFRDEVRGHASVFDRMELRVVAERTPAARVLNYADFSYYDTSPGRTITAYVQRSYTYPNSVVIQSPAFDDRPEFARFDVGRRLIVALVFTNSTVEPGQLLLERAWRVEPASRTLLEPCLGMPAGSSTMEVLDARMVLCPPQGTGACDAGFHPTDAS